MLVEINLLPQKEEKRKSLLVLVIIAVFILLLGGFFVYWLNSSYEKKLANLEQQITTTEQLALNEQQKIVSYESSNSLVELENTVEWAKEYPLKTVPVLNKLTALLPERGFIQTFSYTELGIVNLTVQFESSREAAFYLNSLIESEWVLEARLNNLNAITGFYDRTFGETDEGPDEGSLKNEKYIPRYLGTYEVELNRDVIKKEAEVDSSDEEGGNV